MGKIQAARKLELVDEPGAKAKPKAAPRFLERAKAEGDKNRGNSEWGREMARKSAEKRAAAAAESERIKSLTVEQVREEFIAAKAGDAIRRLWEKATREDDVGLLKWFAEHAIGKPLTRAEVEQSGGTQILIMRPPRDDEPQAAS